MENWLTLLVVSTALFAQMNYTFSDGGSKIRYQLSATEVYASGAVVTHSRGHIEWAGGVIYLLPSPSAMQKIRHQNADQRMTLAPVFYDRQSLPGPDALAAMTEADRSKRMESARRLMTPKVLVHLEESRFAHLMPTNPAAHEKSVLGGWILVTYADAFAALDAVDWMTKQGGWEFTPVFISGTISKR